MHRVPLFAAATFAFATAAFADRPQFLTETSLRLTAARYAPAEVDIRWDGWIGAGIGLVRLRDTTLYFDGDVETVLGHERRSFEANQSNYHLELGARHALSWGEASVFLHHVSRHSVDRAKELPVDWNLLAFGGRGTFELPGRLRVPSRWHASTGGMLAASNVGYRWEARAGTEHDVMRQPWGVAVVGAEIRAMKTSPTERFPRTGFFDAKLEGAVRLIREGRSFEGFLAVERRNDVRLLSPEARRRVVIGIRLGLSAGQKPYDPKAPPSSSPWCLSRWR